MICKFLDTYQVALLCGKVVIGWRCRQEQGACMRRDRNNNGHRQLRWNKGLTFLLPRQACNRVFVYRDGFLAEPKIRSGIGISSVSHLIVCTIDLSYPSYRTKPLSVTVSGGTN